MNSQKNQLSPFLDKVEYNIDDPQNINHNTLELKLICLLILIFVCLFSNRKEMPTEELYLSSGAALLQHPAKVAK